MASLRFLWSNRSKFSVNSKQFYKVWGKRLLSFPELLQRNYRRWKLVQQGATVHETAEIGEVIIDGHKDYLTVGSFAFLGRVTIALHCPVSIGNCVCINDGVRILSASHDVLDPKWTQTSAEIVIDDYAWIGVGAIILPGVHLGYGSVVGAGAVVSKSVAPGEIVVGNPAKAVTKTRSTRLDYNPCEFLTPNRAWLVG
jgi:acetyltransferase-like isoleucine patch superfamily enzyme